MYTSMHMHVIYVSTTHIKNIASEIYCGNDQPHPQASLPCKARYHKARYHICYSPVTGINSKLQVLGKLYVTPEATALLATTYKHMQSCYRNAI